MPRHTLVSLTAACLLSLALGACASSAPNDLAAAREAADHTHVHAVPAAATPTTTPPKMPAEKRSRQADRKVKAPSPKAAKPTTKPTATKPTVTTPKSAAPPSPYFKTPEAAMRYLASAYNRHDTTALKHVTTPVARDNLEGMRTMADNLKLVSCEANRDRGDYVCEFVHDYPAKLKKSGHGMAHFTAAPADKYGWYMTVLIDCS